MITMFHIRNYNEVYHPDNFKGAPYGWRIWLLNWFRYRLELWVQKLVLKSLTRGAKRKSVMEQFYGDVKAEEMAARRDSPLFTETVDVGLRADRYKRGRQSTVLEEATMDGANAQRPQHDAKRPSPLDEMANRYGAPPRQRRYAFGNKTRTSVNPEGDFEYVGRVPLFPQEMLRQTQEVGDGQFVQQQYTQQSTDGGGEPGDGAGDRGPLRSERRLPSGARSRA